MKAAVTEAPRTMRITDVPDAGEPGSGEVLVRPEAVGLCGSDFHYFLGHLGDAVGNDLYPRVQGHEFAGVVEALGPGSPAHLHRGARVAVWPVTACGRCYPCRIGRHNVCSNIRLVGIHRDGALQERVLVPADQVFPVGELDPALSALIEPVSIAIRAVVRARLEAGEKAVVLGAGPIGQAIALVVRERGGRALLVDRLPARLELGRLTGADVLEGDDDVVSRAREWAGDPGPVVAFDATGEPPAVRAAVEMVASAGRVVVVGISDKEVALNVGWFTQRELDVLGTSVCSGEQFAEAVAIVGRNSAVVERLITRQYGLDEAPAAMDFAMRNPAEVMKVVVRPNGITVAVR